jgi:hypothetical protein
MHAHILHNAFAFSISPGDKWWTNGFRNKNFMQPIRKVQHASTVCLRFGCFFFFVLTRVRRGAMWVFGFGQGRGGIIFFPPLNSQRERGESVQTHECHFISASY